LLETLNMPVATGSALYILSPSRPAVARWSRPKLQSPVGGVPARGVQYVCGGSAAREWCCEHVHSALTQQWRTNTAHIRTAVRGRALPLCCAIHSQIILTSRVHTSARADCSFFHMHHRGESEGGRSKTGWHVYDEYSKHIAE